MVRKKKAGVSTPQSPIVISSSSSSPVPSSAGNRASSSAPTARRNSEVKPSAVVTCADVLCVGLSKSKVSTGTNTNKGVGSILRYLPRVVLSEQDAASLDILSDEDVIVFGRSSDGASLSGAIICKALVSKQQQQQSSASSVRSPSYSSPSSSSKKLTSSAATVGSIWIQPSDMLHLLLPHTIHNNANTVLGSPIPSSESHSLPTTTPATPAAPPTQAVLQTPSPNKPFSFQIGGGGDVLYSSPSPSLLSIRKPPKTPSSSSNDRFWILPMESRLGVRVAQQITNNNNNTLTNSSDGPCECRIHLEPLPNNTSIENSNDSSTLVASMTIPSSAARIRERIILATYIGRYVQAREIVRVTFQGKLLQLLITRVEKAVTTTATSQANDGDGEKLNSDQLATSEHEDQLVAEFEKLGLRSSSSSSSPSSDTQQLLQQLSCFRTTKQLYKVTYETKISVAVTSSATTSINTSTGPNHPQHRPADIVEQHVVGLSSVMKQVHDLLWTPLTRPEVFVRNGSTASAAAIKPPRGLLLHGPSGVGKSCLARQIAAEFGESCEVQFINCILLQSQTAIVGQAERLLSQYFQTSTQQEQGRRQRPKLLIFDDIHLICPRRGGGGFTDQLASTLLALLDGIESSSSSPTAAGSLRDIKKAAATTPVVILAITSNPSLLDPALRRPGRLDVEVEVPIPDEPSTRAEILRFHVTKRAGASGPVTAPELTDDDWLMLAKLAKGFTGADCMLAVKEAMRTALFRRLRLTAQSSALPIGEHASAVELTIHDLASAIRATKPSSIKSITVEIPRVPWTSIGGMDEVKRELREAIELPLTHGDLFQRLGVPPPRGILLYGPPGCSKTLMARALATEGQMNFLSVKGPELLSKWLGESERALASLFRRARMASPSIIFFDEIDAIASARGSGDSSGGGGRLLSQLLTELDGVVHTNSSSAKGSKNNRVVVVGATNRPDLLDRALTRPGRIDRMIYVGIPDMQSRRQIFKVALNNKSCESDIDLEYLSRDEVSNGFSGAEIVAICQDAALFALEETDDSPEDGHKGTPKVAMRHLLKATKGMQRQITPEMLEFYASYQNNKHGNI